MNNKKHKCYCENLEVLIRLPFKTGVPLWAIAQDIYKNRSMWRKVEDSIKSWREVGYDIKLYKDFNFKTCGYIAATDRQRDVIRARASGYYQKMGYENEFIPRRIRPYE